jgi:hypothetical protein
VAQPFSFNGTVQFISEELAHCAHLIVRLSRYN